MKIIQLLKNIKKTFCFSAVSKQYLFLIFFFLNFSLICLVARLPRSIVLFAISCAVCSCLFLLCNNKKNGLVYLLLAILICNFPSFLIQNSLAKYYANGNTGEFLRQSSFFFCWIILAFVLNLFVQTIKTNYVNSRLFKYVIDVICYLFLISPVLFPLSYIINWTLGNPPLESNAILAFFQTTYSEASEYFSDFIHLNRAFCVLIVLGGFFYASYKLLSASFIELTKRILFFLLICFITSFVVFKNYFYNVITDPFFQAQETLQDYDEFKRVLEERKNFSEHLSLKKVNAFEGTFVVVIGESLSRSYMGCYGYEKDTTPWQSLLRNDLHSVFFDNAFSCHTHTVQVLTYALTQNNQYSVNVDSWEHAASLIDIARNQLGFNTIWISNQQEIGLFNTPISSLANSTDLQIWTNPNGKNLDEVVLNRIDSGLLSGNRNLIFIHLIGNHKSYNDRYPIQYAKFNDNNWNVDTYLNSVLYNDFILQKIYEKVKVLPNFQGMIYLSDHGDDAYHNLGHNVASFTWDMAKIPLWMIFSNDYVKTHKSVYDCLVEHKFTPFSNDLLFDSVLGIIGGHDSEFYNSKNDISSQSYSHSVKDLKTLYGKKSIIELN